MKYPVCEKQFSYSWSSNRSETAKSFILIFDTFNSGLFGLAYLASLGTAQKQWSVFLNEDVFSQSEFESLCASMELDLPSKTTLYSEAALKVDISIASFWGSVKNRNLLRSQMQSVTTFWKTHNPNTSAYVVCGNSSLRFGLPITQRARTIRLAHGLPDELARMRTFPSLARDLARNCLQSLFFGFLKAYGGMRPYPRFACLHHQCNVASKINDGYRSLSSGLSLAPVLSADRVRTALLLLPASVFQAEDLEIWWQRTHEVLRTSFEAGSVIAKQLLIKLHPSISHRQVVEIEDSITHLAQRDESQIAQVVCRKVPAEVLVRAANVQIVCGSGSSLVYCAFQPSVSEIIEIEPEHIQPRKIGALGSVRPPALEPRKRVAQDWVVSQETNFSGLILTSGLNKFMPADYRYVQKRQFPILKGAK